MYWLGLTALVPALEPNAVVKVEINEAKSDGEDPVKDPVDPDVPLTPVPEMLNPELDEDDDEPEMGAHAKLIVLGTPS